MIIYSVYSIQQACYIIYIYVDSMWTYAPRRAYVRVHMRVLVWCRRIFTTLRNPYTHILYTYIT